MKDGFEREGTYDVIHVRGSEEKDTNIITPTIVIEVSAVLEFVRTIPNSIVLGNHADILAPLVSFLCPVEIGLVPSISSQTSAEVEEAAIGNGVLVVVSSVELRNLPSQSAATGARRNIVFHGLGVEDTLCEG